MKINTDLISKSKWNRSRAAGAPLALGLAVAPGAFAQSHANLAAAKSVNLVSHLEIAAGPAMRMQVVKQRNKRYLTIAAGDATQPVVVDVTKPGQARVVDSSKLAGANPAGALAESTANAPEILALLNAGDLATFGAAHQFTSSARFLADEKRGLIYVLDGGELWIVKTQQPAEDYAAPYDNAYYGG